MSSIISAVKAFAADENGVTAIEYGLIAALVGVAVVAGASKLGTELGTAFSTIADKITAAMK